MMRDELWHKLLTVACIIMVIFIIVGIIYIAVDSLSVVSDSQNVALDSLSELQTIDNIDDMVSEY